MPAKMKIRSAYANLPSAERRVADFILDDPDRAMRMVINEIADAAGVSVPSVTRLARKLGYKGFLDFRVALASGAASDGGTHKLSPIESGDSDSVVIDKLYGATIRALEDTYRALDKERFSEAAGRVAEAKRVFVAGGSPSLVYDVVRQLNMLDVEAISLTDAVAMEVYKSRFRPDDVFIGLSRAGRNKTLTEAILSAKADGATCIYMSNYVNAQSSQTADYFFCTSRLDEMKTITGAESNNSMIALCNVLVLLVARKLGGGTTPAEDAKK